MTRLVWAALFATVLLVSGCAALGPRFDQPIATSFAREPMRRLETERLELYYPAAHRDEALRVARRLDACIAQLRTYPLSDTPRPRLLAYLTSANFNNAYVQPEVSGLPQQMVLAHHMTLEFFNWLELGENEIGDISCHEAVHYVQMQQVDGFWRVVDLITGSFNQPNVFTESWFLEGIATHYEGRLGKETGRPGSPVWNGLFQSVVEKRGGRLNPGDLSPENRELYPFGGNYLVGQQFVAYLARTYGAKKLWQLIDKQGRSIFSPFWVTLRFKSVYGKSIGALFDDFSDDLKAHLTHRQRPADQRIFAKDLGYFARLAVSPGDGAVATLTTGLDDVPRLTIRERDTRVRFSQRLTRILPPRQWVSAGPLEVSGLSFSRDGRFLYLVDADVSSVGDDAGRLWRVDAHTGEVDHIWEGIRGLGGTLSPDGHAYVYVEVTGDTANLVALDLLTNARTPITHFTGAMSLGAPAFSPDGTRIAFSGWTGDGFDLFVLEPDGRSRQLTFDGRFNYGAQWVDADRLVFERETEQRSQIHLVEVSSGALVQLSDAPFLALDPFALGNGTVAFLNRDGAGWTLDAVPLPGPGAPMAAPGAPAPLAQDAVEAPLQLRRDAPYSGLDHLLLPVLHMPFFNVGLSGSHLRTLEGLSLSGSDRLGWHNYAANIWYQTGQHGPNVALGYGNYQLAPWYLAVTAGHFASGDTTDYEASVSASRTFWTTPVSVSFQGLDRTERLLGSTLWRARLLGPSASTLYEAVESTPYGGAKRGLGLSLSGTYYPRQLGSTLDMADVRAELFGYVPLPGSALRRFSLTLSLVGRALPGAPTGLLQVGGLPAGLASVLSRPSREDSPGPLVLLPGGIAFEEGLRGYEDFAFHVDRVAVASALFRYHCPIDYGWASTLYLFPSLFLRQVDVELFGNAARTDVAAARWHRDVGAAAYFRMTFGQALPVSLFYQVAARFDDGLPPLQLVGVSLE